VRRNTKSSILSGITAPQGEKSRRQICARVAAYFSLSGT
jgi:hypothetical protein